ncbi:MAG TPA: hypothetical protein VGG44_06710 [Tepidisphaeraceae bacterium]
MLCLINTKEVSNTASIERTTYSRENGQGSNGPREAKQPRIEQNPGQGRGALEQHEVDGADEPSHQVRSTTQR